MRKLSAHHLAILLTSLLLASTTLGQDVAKKPTAPNGCELDSCISKVLYLPKTYTADELQNVVNMFRVLADIKHVDQNQTEHTILLEGTAEQIAMAEKLLSVSESLRSSGSHIPSSVLVYQLKPSLSESEAEKARSNSSVATYTSCELNTCFIKVLHLPDFATASELQDVVNMVRTVAGFTRLVPHASGHTIWLKGTAEQFAIADRLVSVMESLQSSGGHNRSSVLVLEVKGSMPEPAVSEKFSEQTILNLRRNICDLTICVIKAFYLPDLSQDQLHDVINRVRTTTQVTFIVPSPARHVIVFRGTSEQVALAEKLANE